MRELTTKFEALRCRDCAALDPGPRELCPNCHSADLDRCTLDGKGTLVSWTTIRRAPTQFKDMAPYTVAVVDLDAGVRVTGRLLGNVSELVLGSAVATIALESGAYVFEELGR